MNLREELLIGKSLAKGQETALAVLLTREYVARLVDERLFKPEGITTSGPKNVLRILKGGPPEGYLIREIRRRMIARNADVPRLVDRLKANDLVQRKEDTVDRRGCRVLITEADRALVARLAGPQEALDEELGKILLPGESSALLDFLERLRDGIRDALVVGD